jgi:hypothetical protein
MGDHGTPAAFRERYGGVLRIQGQAADPFGQRAPDLF